MKIIYIANIRLPTEKAHGVQIMKMCEALATLGNDVELVVTDRATPITDEPFAYYGISKLFSIRRLHTWDTVSLGRLGFTLESLVFALRAAFYARATAHDVVYTRDAIVVAVSALFGVKTVWEVHTAAAGIINRIAARRAQKIIAISGGLAGYYQKLGVLETKFLVAHDAAEPGEYTGIEQGSARANLGLPKDVIIVEYMGKLKTMGAAKGVEGIIEAAGIVHKRHSEVVFLFVGLNKDELAETSALLKKFGVSSKNYILVEHVSRTLVPPYLRAADVLVMNYPDEPHYARFMSPMKLFEYMASGRPMVTSDLPSIREVLPQDAAEYVKADDPQALAVGICRLVENPEHAASVAAQALGSVERHTWEYRAHAITASIAG